MPDVGTENLATDKDDDDNRNVVTDRKEERRIINRIVNVAVCFLCAKEAYGMEPVQ
jgi:hypothetical protein